MNTSTLAFIMQYHSESILKKLPLSLNGISRLLDEGSVDSKYTKRSTIPHNLQLIHGSPPKEMMMAVSFSFLLWN